MIIFYSIHRLTNTGTVSQRPVRVNPETVQSQQDDMSDVEENDGEAAAVKERGRMEEEKEYEDGENEDEQNETQTEDVEGEITMYIICIVVADPIFKRGSHSLI